MNPHLSDPGNLRESVAQDSIELVIAAYRRDIDRALIRENLKKSHEERIRCLQELQRFADELKRAGNTLRDEP